MKLSDEYYTLAKSSTGEYKDRGSKFIAYANYVSSEKSINEQLDFIKSEHPKSRHVCYAYALGIDRSLMRANDDGEPSGTAGKPIYNRILSHDLTDTLIAVVRYFGGTKLGTTGLIKAYKQSAEDAISANTIIKKHLSTQYQLKFDYSIMGDLMNHLKQLNIPIESKSLDENPMLTISLRNSAILEQLNRLKAKMLNQSLEQITEKTAVPGLKISEC